MSIDLSQLSAADIAAIVALNASREAAARESRKAAREGTRAFIARFVGILSSDSSPAGPEQVFKSGAQGWSLGGKDVDVTLADGTTRKARVSILVRWEDTIPASDKDA